MMPGVECKGSKKNERTLRKLDTGYPTGGEKESDSERKQPAEQSHREETLRT